MSNRKAPNNLSAFSPSKRRISESLGGFNDTASECCFYPKQKLGTK